MTILRNYLFIIFFGLFAHSALAEPYLAVRTGLKCMACHVNPAGGGKRTDYGRLYGQSIMPARPTQTPFTEVASRYLDIGADLRSSVTYRDIPNEDEQLAFSTERATLYIEGKLIPNKLTLYLDERFAPGASNREAWLMYQTDSKDWYLRAGKFYLPYGLRLEDDTAFIRQITGVSFANADNGIELGYDNGPWSTRASLTNGTNSGAETNTQKQLSLRLAYIKYKWRVGASFNTNSGTEGQARSMQNIFAAANIFDLEVLAEIDWIKDSAEDQSDVQQLVSFIEVNKEIFKGHNIKLSYEYLDPDQDTKQDQSNRTSLMWEFTPISLMQIRVGTRISDGIPQNNDQNTDTVFAQLHVWF